VKLADESFKVKSSEAGGYYASALRAIGQDLSELFPQQVEIDCDGTSFEVRVRCERKRAEKKFPQADKPGLKNTLHKLANYRLDKPTAEELIATVTLSYGPDDINRLNDIGLHRRAQVGKVPDVNSLGESLRTIGRIVDADKGQLIRVLKDQRRIVFDCVDKSGATRKIEMTRSELFKAQQSFYNKRGGSTSLDSWKGSS
jgi:hypothetical protein